MYLISFQSWELILQFVSSRLMKLDETTLLLMPNCYEVIAMAATSGRLGSAIVMSYTEINKSVSQ